MRPLCGVFRGFDNVCSQLGSKDTSYSKMSTGVVYRECVSTDTFGMKHLKDAKQLLEQGQSRDAMGIVDHVLSLAPNNPDALILKASILDSWGHFEESLAILHKVAKNSKSQETLQTIAAKLAEEREALIYSQLTSEGRWYFSVSAKQVFLSLFGLTGCVLFLFAGPQHYDKPGGLFFLGALFLALIALPAALLLISEKNHPKKILVGVRGLSVFMGFRKQFYPWEQLQCAVIEYHPDLTTGHLRLLVYPRTGELPVLNLDISEKHCPIRARRHFVRLVLSYVNLVSYVAKQ